MRSTGNCGAVWRLMLLIMSLETFSAVGCSGSSNTKVNGRPPVYKASGKVMYQGKPLADALVLYHPVNGEISAYGRTNSKGEFVLETFGVNDGAPEGSYKVVVTKTEYNVKRTAYDSPQEKSAARIPKPLLPIKYSRKETTDLKAEIRKSGPNESFFEVLE